VKFGGKNAQPRSRGEADAMMPIPVPDLLYETFKKDGYQRIVVGAPNGRLDGDGGSVDTAGAVEALTGPDAQGFATIKEYWRLTAEEVEQLKNGHVIELTWWMNKMPVHGLQIQPAE
jgi:hypothetical protein